MSGPFMSGFISIYTKQGEKSLQSVAREISFNLPALENIYLDSVR